MIVSFQRKGLKLYFHTGSKRGIQVAHAAKLRRILSVLDAATEITPITAIPGFRTHDLDGFWAVKVSGNWRIIFRFIGEDVELVDYLYYH
ncbi:type II toxin-antitoxin system RelE/ParE family toxin [Corynebacterium epidermidicanis]|uniref:type II toxin-antitoxin system RelE/ParE family toxin n=1 Tax=Corynebacterium epidermidicanis TaxID=1050174 RepID=UPI0009FEE480